VTPLAKEVPRINSERSLPQYWGEWFSSLGASDMKETNLNIFYQFGVSLHRLHDEIRVGIQALDLFIHFYNSQEWLSAFMKETEQVAHVLKDSRASTETILKFCEDMIAAVRADIKRLVTQAELSHFVWAKDNFEKNFEREHRNLSVFTVTPKGIYDTRALIERPEDMFPENLHSTLGAQLVNDLKQAGRCLAFDIPTACAFHVCRGTEAVMIQYLELLMKKPWPHPKNRDWHAYIQHMENHDVPEKITDRLNEIRISDRNAYNHPDINVTLEEAPIIFGLCTNVVFLMGQEMSKLA
jgi:hypothetical protein